ncbi:MAG: hypothetical protein GXO11_03890 [Epsilonproteobacteria bacterium]|nr:hypothetical protein [Campylobacterota bacterium]
MKYLFSLLFSSFFFMVTFTGCGGDNTDEPVIPDIDHIEVDKPKVNSVYATQDSLQLTARVYLNDGSQQDITHAAIWSTDYTKATILAGSFAAATNMAVNVPVSVKYFDFKSNTIYISIIPMTQLFFIDGGLPADIPEGERIFSASAIYQDGVQKAIGEGNSRNIEWSVSGSAEITDTENGIATINFSAGDATVTLSAFDFNITKSYHIY